MCVGGGVLSVDNFLVLECVCVCVCLFMSVDLCVCVESLYSV